MSFFPADAAALLSDKDAGSSHARRFLMVRKQDVSGISGTGVVAEGVVFTRGRAVLHWLVEPCSVAVYESMGDLPQGRRDGVVAIHGHNGSTEFYYIDNGG